MTGKASLTILLICLPFFSACGPIPDYRGFASGDVSPPVFSGVSPLSPSRILLSFDTPVSVSSDGFSLRPGLGGVSASSEGSSVFLTLAEDQIPGMRYRIEGFVRDASGNSMSFMADFYGFNPDLPRVLINEFTTQGSSTHPDLVEFRVLEGGNLAGMAFFQGLKEDFEALFVFPPLAVEAGDFVLLHCKPQGLSVEIDETNSKAESGGYDASESAWDFWLSGGKGLSGNNGVLSLYENPGGEIMDAVLYSNRTSQSDTDYRGFGSSSLRAQAERLAELSAWVCSGEEIKPEDAVNPAGSTATRSICRGSGGSDTDSARDWHIVPTGKYSFGRENSDEVYEP